METKLHPWQEKFLMSIESGGVKPGEMTIMMSSRQAGKSVFTQQAIDRLMRDLNSQPISELVLNEQPVHGAKYHTVEPIGGNWLEMEDWCYRSFGEPGDMWDSEDWCWPETARWLMNNRKFLFRNQKDRDWFLIRWSSQ